MNLFKDKTDKKPDDVKMIRENLLLFIKEQLSKLEGGEGKNIKGINLFISAKSEEKHIYEASVYFDSPDRFKNEVQRISDDYVINLPEEWAMDITFVDEFPLEVMQIPELNAALFIRTHKNILQKSATAYIRILNGEAENDVYIIKSSDGKITIGRDKKVQNDDGFFRINVIAFPGDSKHESNKYISRQHAHIKFNNDSGQFYLFADENGVPPRNKIKIRTADEDTPVKLYSTKIGYALKEGDQIMLGQSAILEFTYLNEV
jgi:hypothetical protein